MINNGGPVPYTCEAPPSSMVHTRPKKYSAIVWFTLTLLSITNKVVRAHPPFVLACRDLLDSTLCDQVCHCLAGSPHENKNDRHDGVHM
jgi:hypothetical protein